MYEAQAQLTDAYLAANQAAEARVIAEDLVAREPWEPAHIDRFRRALVMLRVSDPDTLIAERLSGQAPFMAHDPFFDGPDPVTGRGGRVRGRAAGRGRTGGRGRSARPRTTAPSLDARCRRRDQSRRSASGRSRRPGGDEIDLTGELGDLDDQGGGEPQWTPRPRGPGALDQAFARIRTDAESDADFSAQHMTLARTYLEIGMLDEAVASLQTAVRSPRQRFEAAAALGRVYERRGEPALAIEWFERAAEAPAPDARGGTRVALRPRRRSSTAPVKRRGRWPYSSNCRPTPATIATCRPGSTASHACRPEADISFLTRILFAAYFLEAGLILVVAPWSGFWDRNLFLVHDSLAPARAREPLRARRGFGRRRDHGGRRSRGAVGHALETQPAEP